ncbi:YfcC family protein [Peptoniphilus stercorisuis]|uniref:Ion transporter superfamily protein YfcC n=1 Tax=Peptoniphilus stercorisuis TaxID=1436965 RepID=A0ABS4KD13_9FIRM|nr:AbgT family transporter [Peptoniphilus stercorisuis]MBP2025652.1 putative ion transporter superfamily protein YfcC [Peptoniphilus stercorisuis]
MFKKNQKKESKNINAFLIVFGVIVACYILSLFVSPGTFDREVVNGRTIVIPNSFHSVEKVYLGPQSIFQAIPNGLESSAGMMFLVMLVAGCIEVYKRTKTLDKGVSKILSKAEVIGSEKILIIIMIIFACFGGFLGWNEQIVPFIPIIISLCIALGYDLMTGVACSALIDMISFSISPTSVYTVGISHEIAELPMFSGFLFRFVLLVIFDVIVMAYVLRYARKVKRDKSLSITSDIDDTEFRIDYTDITKDPLSKRQSLSLLVFLITFIVAILGVSKLGWSMNDLSACFLFTAVAAGLINKLNPNEIIDSIIDGAKDGLRPALVIGLARGIQWILTESGIIDPIINAISKPLMVLPGSITAIAVMVVIALFNGLITSGSAKAMALMPILIPLADLIGMTRQTMILAFQLGDGLTNSMWFTSGTLLIFLTIAKIPLKKWWKFVTPLILMLTAVSVVALVVATNIGYGPF